MVKSLSTLAEKFYELKDGSAQDLFLKSTADEWSLRSRTENEQEMLLGFENRTTLLFLAQFVSYLKRPYGRYSTACIDRLLEEMSTGGGDPEMIHELAYSARMSATTFKFWESILSRLRNCSEPDLVSLCRLIDSEDNWGHFSSVDTRLLGKSILQERFLASSSPQLDAAISRCLVFDHQSRPEVIAKARNHVDEAVVSRCLLGQRMPYTIRPWWVWHFVGSNTFLTGTKIRSPLWSRRVRSWLLKALLDPRFRLFCCFLLELIPELDFGDEDIETLCHGYFRAREGKNWCCLGSRMGHWSSQSWLRFLFEHFEPSALAPHLMKSGLIPWEDLSQAARYDWVAWERPSADMIQDLVFLVQARGAALYEVVDEQVAWTGLVGAPWSGPPRTGVERFLGQDLVEVTTLSPRQKIKGSSSPNAGESRAAALIHLALSNSKGILLYRWLPPGDGVGKVGFFQSSEFSAGCNYRDKVLLETD